MKEASFSNASVLLLVSDPPMRTVLHDILDRAGCLVVAVDSLGPAVDRLKVMRPDLLITRPFINSMPGAMAAHYLRTWCPGLPVLIVDGFADDERVNVPLAVDEIHVFPKPFAPHLFLEAVKGILEDIRKQGRSPRNDHPA
jgi:CheY-like chemotaxis protein